ncbi:MAG: CDP-glycerol glycerophosphotransferase family protein [Chloroflexota bacterium]
MKGIILTVRIAAVRISFALASLLPLRSRVVLATAHAARIGGNLVSIRDDLAARHPEVHVVVLARRPSRGVRGRIAALGQAIEAGYHLATARVFIVDDYFFPMYVIRPRDGTTFIQTWHACGAFKKVGYSLHDKSFGADSTLTERVRLHSNYDVCLVASEASAPFYAEAFGQPLERFTSRLGIPRTDVFFGDERIARGVAAVRARYPLPAGRRVILYAPTFRGDTITDAHATDDLDLRALKAVLGEDHVLLVRLHPFVRSQTPIGPDLADFAIDVSDYPDINELMLVSDVLVTDYSSAIYEFSLLGRPMVFFAPDYAAYEKERGFYFDYRTGVPGPIFEETEPLAAYLRAGEFDLERVDRFRRASFDVADGGSATRVTDALILPSLTRAGDPR